MDFPVCADATAQMPVGFAESQEWRNRTNSNQYLIGIPFAEARSALELTVSRRQDTFGPRMGFLS